MAVVNLGVLLQDAGIAKMPGYKAYDDGAKDGIWIKNYKGQPYLGQVSRPIAGLGSCQACWGHGVSLVLDCTCFE